MGAAASATGEEGPAAPAATITYAPRRARSTRVAATLRRAQAALEKARRETARIGNAADARVGSEDASSQVLVERADDLRDADWVGGESDPYALCRLGPAGSDWGDKGAFEWRSATVADKANPVWGLAFRAAAEEGWELHCKVFDDDAIKDDCLGEIRTKLPAAGGLDAALPVTGPKPKGTVSVKLWADDGTEPSPPWCAQLAARDPDAPAVLNGTARGGDEGFLASLAQIGSGATVAYERVLEALSRVFGRRDASEPHNVSYVADMVAFGLLAKSYSSFFHSRTKDGGETLEDFPGPGSTTIISHARVAEGLSTICARVAAGEATRAGPDSFLGLLRLNGAFWRRDKTSKAPPYVRRADLPLMNRGGAAAATF